MGVCCEAEDYAQTPADPKKMTLKAERLSQIPKIEINMMDTDEGYAKSIDEIWRLYDFNQNGKLEEEEAKEFLKMILRQVNG